MCYQLCPTLFTTLVTFRFAQWTGSIDGKISNLVSASRHLSGPLHVVELEGPTHDKFDACANDSVSFNHPKLHPSCKSEAHKSLLHNISDLLHF